MAKCCYVCEKELTEQQLVDALNYLNDSDNEDHVDAILDQYDLMITNGNDRIDNLNSLNESEMRKYNAWTVAVVICKDCIKGVE